MFYVSILMRRGKMKLGDKKGTVGDQLGIFWFLFLMLIIAGSLAIGIFMFYGNGYDYREIEAEILNYKIRGCILESEVTEGFFKDFYEKCRLDKKMIGENNIIKICDSSKDECLTSADYKFLAGDVGICWIKSVKGNNVFGKCAEESFLKNGKKFTVITGSTQFSRRVQG